MVLALVSVPAVAWSLQVPIEPWVLDELDPSNPPVTYRRMGFDQAVLLALAAVVPAALVGGFLGGRLRRHFPVAGVVLALSLAWLTGVILLPLAANLLDVPFISGVHCISSCSIHLRDDQPLGGALAYATSLGGALFFVPIWLVPLIFFILAVRWNMGNSVVPIFFAILLHAGLHSTAIVGGGAIPYLCLAVGVLFWSLILRARDRHEHRNAT